MKNGGESVVFTKTKKIFLPTSTSHCRHQQKTLKKTLADCFVPTSANRSTPTSADASFQKKKCLFCYFPSLLFFLLCFIFWLFSLRSENKNRSVSVVLMYWYLSYFSLCCVFLFCLLSRSGRFLPFFFSSTRKRQLNLRDVNFVLVLFFAFFSSCC